MNGLRFSLDQLNPKMREQVVRKLAEIKAPVRTVKCADDPEPAKPNKYKAVALVVDGERFDSKREYRAYLALVVREKAGEISGLRRQVRFSLFDPGKQCRGEHWATYRADFVWTEKGKIVVADAKSHYTHNLRGWARTKSMMRACHNHEVVEL